jgi:branched-chain amino acid transport system substrate-binding protein
LALLLAVLLSPGAGWIGNAAGKPIKIGATVSLEGKYLEPSLMIRDAYKLWAKKVNSGGGLLGRPVELVLPDDKSDPERAQKLYRRLIEEQRVDLVLSPYGTPLTLAASAMTERAGYVMLASAASGEKIWDRGYRYIFGVYAVATRYFIGVLDLAARHGQGSAAVVREEGSGFTRDAAAGAVEWAKRFGMEVVYEGSSTGTAKDLQNLLKEIRPLNPSMLLFAAYPPACFRMLEEMEKLEYRPPGLAMTIAPTFADFYERAGEIADGIFAPSQWEPDERIPFPGTAEFIREFREYSGNTPSYHGGAAYAACEVLQKAVEAAESLDHGRLRDYIMSLDTVTVIGRFKVDHTGKQIGHNPITIQWQDGIKEIVYPTKMQTKPPRF